MNYIGDQGKEGDVLKFIQASYHIPVPGEKTKFYYDGVSYVLDSVEGWGFGILSVPVKEVTPVNLKDFFNKLQYSNVEMGKPHTYTDRPWKATSIHHLVRLSNNIARLSRRGRGNILLCHDKNILKKLEKYSDWLFEYYKVIETPLVKTDDVIVLFAGGANFDKPFVMLGNNIYASPHYNKLMMKVKI